MTTHRYQVLAAGGIHDYSTGVDIAADRSSPAWQAYLAWLSAGGTPLPPDPITGGDLTTAIARRCEEIDAYAAGLRNRVVLGISPGEMASWVLKRSEALAYRAGGGDAQAPMLARIAAGRGVPTSAMVDKVLAAAAPYEDGEVAIDAVRGRHCDAVRACTTVQEVVLYDWHADWPEVP